VILRLLKDSNNYLRELAALRAHHTAVRLRAIALLDESSLPVLKQIIAREPDPAIVQAAKARLDSVNQCG